MTVCRSLTEAGVTVCRSLTGQRVTVCRSLTEAADDRVP